MQTTRGTIRPRVVKLAPANTGSPRLRYKTVKFSRRARTREISRKNRVRRRGKIELGNGAAAPGFSAAGSDGFSAIRSDRKAAFPSKARSPHSAYCASFDVNAPRVSRLNVGYHGIRNTTYHTYDAV